jgi:hypothetical protein
MEFSLQHTLIALMVLPIVATHIVVLMQSPN